MSRDEELPCGTTVVGPVFFLTKSVRALSGSKTTANVEGLDPLKKCSVAGIVSGTL